jgi:hypothetical protein
VGWGGVGRGEVGCVGVGWGGAGSIPYIYIYICICTYVSIYKRFLNRNHSIPAICCFLNFQNGQQLKTSN